VERGPKENQSVNNATQYSEDNPNNPLSSQSTLDLSCKRLIAYAILISIFFLVVHLLGFREYTSILSGTGSFNTWKQYYGTLYIILYNCFVLIVPILLIATTFLQCAKIIKLKYIDRNKVKIV
jgi:hypothetical protein